jgi:hypothetical protein
MTLRRRARVALALATAWSLVSACAIEPVKLGDTTVNSGVEPDDADIPAALDAGRPDDAGDADTVDAEPDAELGSDAADGGAPEFDASADAEKEDGAIDGEVDAHDATPDARDATEDGRDARPDGTADAGPPDVTVQDVNRPPPDATTVDVDEHEGGDEG